MSRNILKEKGLIIAEHSTTLEVPVTYVIHRPTPSDLEGFKVSIYVESWLNGHISEESRDANSDIPLATWSPDGQGLKSITHRFMIFRDLGLAKEMEEFCQQAYDALKDDDDD